MYLFKHFSDPGHNEKNKPRNNNVEESEDAKTKTTENIFSKIIEEMSC